jgi:hypothetical protein
MVKQLHGTKLGIDEKLKESKDTFSIFAGASAPGV